MCVCVVVFPLQFVHTLGLENVHLIGVSMGSMISASYASLYPEEVESLSIMCIPGVFVLYIYVCVCVCVCVSCYLQPFQTTM